MRGSAVGASGEGMGSVGDGGTVMSSGEGVMVETVWLLVAVGVVTGVAGALGVVGAVGVTVVLGAVVSGVKNFSVVLSWCSSKWSRAHCFRCLSVSTAVPVRAFLALRFFFFGGGGGLSSKRALCTSRTRCRRCFLAEGDSVRVFDRCLTWGLAVIWYSG